MIAESIDRSRPRWRITRGITITCTARKLSLSLSLESRIEKWNQVSEKRGRLRWNGKKKMVGVESNRIGGKRCLSIASRFFLFFSFFFCGTTERVASESRTATARPFSLSVRKFLSAMKWKSRMSWYGCVREHDIEKGRRRSSCKKWHFFFSFFFFS